jgi:membrane-associated phospholipid phosphatase
MTETPAMPITGKMVTTVYCPRWELQDLVFLGYLGIVGVLLLVLGVGSGRVEHPWVLIAWHLGIGAAGMGARWLPGFWNHPLARFIRWWYPVLLCTLCFEAVGKMIHLLQPQLIDAHLIAAEQFIFSRVLTPLLQHYANRWLTELMYFCYSSYYFFIPGVGLPLYLRMRNAGMTAPGAAFREYMLAVSLTFWVCYLHFLLTPAGGPIFWLDYPGGVLELRGGPITALEQWLFNHGTIVGGAFPSSHVAVAVVATSYAVRFRVAPLFFVPVALGLAISTLYNGYHYGVDVIYGIVIAAVMSVVVPKLFAWQENKLGRVPAPATACCASYPSYIEQSG